MTYCFFFLNSLTILSRLNFSFHDSNHKAKRLWPYCIYLGTHVKATKIVCQPMHVTVGVCPSWRKHWLEEGTQWCSVGKKCPTLVFQGSLRLQMKPGLRCQQMPGGQNHNWASVRRFWTTDFQRPGLVSNENRIACSRHRVNTGTLYSCSDPALHICTWLLT